MMSDRGEKFFDSVTKALAATIDCSPITAPFMITAPMPITHEAPMAQPWPM
jgi:hypothetical protein